MAENKTKATAASVEEFIRKLPAEQQQKDSLRLLEMMKSASGEEPKLWSNGLIGFGEVRLKSPKTGREVDWIRIGFAPRKANLSLYLYGGLNTHHAEALTKLGKHKTGGGCIYINKLCDVDEAVLQELIAKSLTLDYYAE